MKQFKKHFTDITSNKGESQADDINMEFIPTVSSFILASLGSLPYEDSDLNALLTDLPDNTINPVWNVQGMFSPVSVNLVQILHIQDWMLIVTLRLRQSTQSCSGL